MARKSRRSRRVTRSRSAKGRSAAAAGSTATRGELRWRVLPCARDWRLTTAAVAIVGLVLVVVYLSFEHIGWVVLSAIVLLGALASFFLPTTYVLDDEGVTVRSLLGTTRREWEALRSHRVGATGVLLSPFARVSRLESFRGICLRFDDNREEVMAIVRAKTEPCRGRDGTAREEE